MSISNEDSSLESDQITNNNNNKVVVIGLGQLGLPVAKYVKEHGFDTYGYDINQKAMQSAETNYGIK
ncbi:MAG TPA: NAD(P)-dependent oxidoreductase, partial [Candidatus Nitrosocosmicus sp.]|nr:NAD(P)-dependent oxidoreductase [Candidatus Nitrosocosmicus sp.]